MDSWHSPATVGNSEKRPKLKAHYKPAQTYWHKTYSVVKQGSPPPTFVWRPRVVSRRAEMPLALLIKQLGLKQLSDMIVRAGLTEAWGD